MEKVINESLKKKKDLEKIKTKIFSKTLNIKHNLKKKIFYIFQIQPYISKNHTKERLNLTEDCLSHKLIENLELYYNIDEAKNNLLDIIKDEDRKYFHIYPNYYSLENFISNEMFKYKTEKGPIDYKIDIINKMKKLKEEKRIKKKSNFEIINKNEFFNTMGDEELRTSQKKMTKNFSIRKKDKKKKEKKNIIILKTEKIANDKDFKELIDKREDLSIINKLNKSIKKINLYNNKLKLKSANLFYIIFSKIIERLKYGLCEYFIDKFVTRYNQIINLRKKASVVKTMIIPVKQKFIKKKKTKRFSVFENKFVIPKLFDEYHRNSVDNKYKLKIRPVYLFNKRFNDEYKTFNNFFQEWNSNKDKQMIKYIYKYTQQNFSTNHHMLYSQISKLIKTNKLDTLEKEVNKNKNDTTRLNTVSNLSTKSKYQMRSKRNTKEFHNINTKKEIKFLLNLKYQL
jgi:hypothetical protein